MSKAVAIAYIPVLHRGYLQFLEECEKRGISEFYLVEDEILARHEELDYLNRKDRLRALRVGEMTAAITAVSNLQVAELNAESIARLQSEAVNIFTPKEDIGRVILDTYFAVHAREEWPVFVRWNQDNVSLEKEPAVSSVPLSEFQQKVVALMKNEADKSFDWWRQVGAALIKNREIVYVTHNAHLPEEQQPNIDGDTRSLFKKGINIEYSTAAHAEVVAIGVAAKVGLSTEGAELYVTDFPCPYCARLIASAGIKTVYFLKGYAVMEGDEFLKQAGVEVVKLSAE